MRRFLSTDFFFFVGTGGCSHPPNMSTIQKVEEQNISQAWRTFVAVMPSPIISILSHLICSTVHFLIDMTNRCHGKEMERSLNITKKTMSLNSFLILNPIDNCGRITQQESSQFAVPVLHKLYWFKQHEAPLRR